MSVPYAGCPPQGTVRLRVAKLVMVLCCLYKNFTTTFPVFRTTLPHRAKPIGCLVSVFAMLCQFLRAGLVLRNPRLLTCSRTYPLLSELQAYRLYILQPEIGAHSFIHCAWLRSLRFYWLTRRYTQKKLTREQASPYINYQMKMILMKTLSF